MIILNAKNFTNDLNFLSAHDQKKKYCGINIDNLLATFYSVEW